MFLSSLLKCVPLRFGLPPHFHVIKKKKEKKRGCQRSKHCQYEREKIHPETLLNQI